MLRKRDLDGRTAKRAPALVGGFVGCTGLMVGSMVGPAWAGANGSTTQTQHAHGADAAGQVVIDFLPQNLPAPLPSTCWVNPNYALVSTDGNGIQHSTVNKAGDFWFTTTYTGDAAMYPIVFQSPGVPQVDANGNDVVDMSQPPVATGHLTTWFGQEDNKQNGVNHATLSFEGTLASGQSVSLHGDMHIGSSASGNQQVHGSVYC
jgi:hypothetical protein